MSGVLSAAVEAAAASVWATVDNEGEWSEQSPEVQSEMRAVVEFYASHLAPLIEMAVQTA